MARGARHRAPRTRGPSHSRRPSVVDRAVAAGPRRPGRVPVSEAFGPALRGVRVRPLSTRRHNLVGYCGEGDSAGLRGGRRWRRPGGAAEWADWAAGFGGGTLGGRQHVETGDGGGSGGTLDEMRGEGELVARQSGQLVAGIPNARQALPGSDHRLCRTSSRTTAGPRTSSRRFRLRLRKLKTLEDPAAFRSWITGSPGTRASTRCAA